MVDFKEIPGYPGYSVTTDGRVWSHPKFRGAIKHSGKWLTPHTIKGGYLRVRLSVHDRKRVVVHRLVAMAFIPNPDNLPEVDHIDGNKANNDVSNLRWVSKQQNQKLMYERCGHPFWTYRTDLQEAITCA